MKTKHFKRIIEMIRKIGSKLCSLMKIYRKPSHFKIILRDLLKVRNKIYSNNDHLHAAMVWLCRAQDRTGCGGVSGGYYFAKGWMPPYPETTGYIIPTFLKYASLNSDCNYFERAIKMGDWEIEIQLPSGAVRGGMGINEYPIVFNTGQVILGWISLFKATGLDRFLYAAIKAANWLLSIQDDDGKWSKHTYMGIPHVYHARVAWPLLELYELTKKQSYKIAAVNNLNWALHNQNENGWYHHNSFNMKINPYTHNIIYAARGLFESGVLLNEFTYIESADRTLKVLIKIFENNNFLAGDFNEKWESQSNYSCLAGDAQFSVLLMLLHKFRVNERYLNISLKINEFLRSTQSLNNQNNGLRGGIKGSDPIWGIYQSYSYPNWAAKFFVDALLLETTT